MVKPYLLEKHGRKQQNKGVRWLVIGFIFVHEVRLVIWIKHVNVLHFPLNNTYNKSCRKTCTYIRAFYCRVRRQKRPCFHAVALRSRCVKRSAAASSIHAARRSRRTATLPYPPCRRQGNTAASANRTHSSPISPWQLPHRSSTFLAKLSNCVQHALRVAPRYSFVLERFVTKGLSAWSFVILNNTLKALNRTTKRSLNSVSLTSCSHWEFGFSI